MIEEKSTAGGLCFFIAGTYSCHKMLILSIPKQTNHDRITEKIFQ